MIDSLTLFENIVDIFGKKLGYPVVLIYKIFESFLKSFLEDRSFVKACLYDFVVLGMQSYQRPNQLVVDICSRRTAIGRNTLRTRLHEKAELAKFAATRFFALSDDTSAG